MEANKPRGETALRQRQTGAGGEADGLDAQTERDVFCLDEVLDRRQTKAGKRDKWNHEQ